jgi:hypothetical protein
MADDIPDEQDQSEVFDETHMDDEGDGDLHFDETDDVLDVTQADGDADDEDVDIDDLDDLSLEETLGADGIEEEADAQMGVDSPRLSVLDTESDGQRGADEVELVYSGLMRNAQGAQASAAHWEAKRLSDDDIEDLGYGPDSTKETAR